MRELGAGLVLGDDAAREALVGLDDVLHALLEGAEVLRGERTLHVEVVVEAVPDGRTDAQLGLGEQLLHRLREHVGGRVPEDGTSVLGVDRHCGDLVTVREDVGQVLELALDAGHHDRSVGEQVGGRGAVGDRPLFGAAVGREDGDLGHVDSWCSAWRP